MREAVKETSYKRLQAKKELEERVTVLASEYNELSVQFNELCVCETQNSGAAAKLEEAMPTWRHERKQARQTWWRDAASVPASTRHIGAACEWHALVCNRQKHRVCRQERCAMAGACGAHSARDPTNRGSRYPRWRRHLQPDGPRQRIGYG